MKLERALDIAQAIICAAAWVWLVWRVVVELSK